MPCRAPPAPHPHRKREAQCGHAKQCGVNHEHSKHLKPPSSFPDADNITLSGRRIQGVFRKIFQEQKENFCKGVSTKSPYFLRQTTLSRNTLWLGTIPVDMFSSPSIFSPSSWNNSIIRLSIAKCKNYFQL